MPPSTPITDVIWCPIVNLKRLSVQLELWSLRVTHISTLVIVFSRLPIEPDERREQALPVDCGQLARLRQSGILWIIAAQAQSEVAGAVFLLGHVKRLREREGYLRLCMYFFLGNRQIAKSIFL